MALWAFRGCGAPRGADLSDADSATDPRYTKALLIAQIRTLSQSEQVEILSQAGFQPREIAGLIGTTRNAVSQALARLKGGQRKRRQ